MKEEGEAKTEEAEGRTEQTRWQDWDFFLTSNHASYQARERLFEPPDKGGRRERKEGAGRMKEGKARSEEGRATREHGAGKKDEGAGRRKQER